MTETHSTKSAAKSKRNKAPLIATAVMLSLGLLGGGYWFSYGQYFESTDNAYLQGDITTISPKVSGYIVKSYVSDNQQVKQGQLLVQIDDRDYQAALSQSEAHLVVAKSSVKNLIAQQTLQRSQINQAESRVDSAQAEYDRAVQQVSRSRSLLKRNYASQDELDSMLAQQKVTLAELEEAKANLAASNDQLIVIASEIEQAQASVTEAQAQLQQAQLNLDYTKVYAPTDGIIGKRSVREGLLVQAGAPLMSLVPENGVWIEANFKETQLSGIHKGQKVEVELDAFPGKTLEGVVDSFSPATGAKFALLPPENATGNFTKIVQRVPVKITLPEQNALEGRLLPGLSVVATIDTRG
ncbi:HlyD family secretion protein [Vibrio brasiliensis]|uniref:Multidrug resistance protein A n=1 Tax=Vibrio brasiliensis LMG 20546 TaxID=945543 RepID=E8LQW5_9VIBR|nr:HlyD family secretion protein [Vibrio brasiliensis]EGA66891.1 Multidrug resistance protein A [Vibrio brasiliensis LMG 20546]MCG9725737.1 HlyD family secretion protein [Vibrio brasiliensis]MCG9753152.1 HlyD family secretion protein [Vibrio brasiliensis]